MTVYGNNKYCNREYLVFEPRVSTCELEADIQASDIMNTQEIDMGMGTNNS